MELFGVKDPEETIIIAFDYTKAMDAGETISAATTTVIVKDGADASSAAMVSGAANFAAQNGRVLQKIVAGVADVDYAIRCKATTSSGKILVLAALLPVKAADKV